LVKADELKATVNEELSRACTTVSVPVFTSHALRHALGYHLLRSGCPLRYIQAILGHKRIKDTETYTKVDASDVQRVFEACHPRMAP
jgi:site-specific recombinase XerD